MRQKSTILVVTLALLAGTALIFVGCSGGNGPTLPSPDAGSGDDDTVETEDFIVEAGETVRYDTDTTIDCDSARIDGEVIGADGSAPGEAGTSITIRSAGDVEINGTVRAGSGVAGTDQPHTVTEAGGSADGGDGGSITIIAGEAQDSESTTEQAAGPGITLGPDASLTAGDAGDGGASLTGGPGGEGGSISLQCAAGTLSIDQHPGLLHLGLGGNGGLGSVQGEDLLTTEAPEQLPNIGGDSGFFTFSCAELVGIEMQDSSAAGDGERSFFCVWDAGVVAGGIGGDAGDYYFGVDPDTGDSTWPTDAAGYESTSHSPQARTSQTDEPQRTRANGYNDAVGADGGDGVVQGGDGGDRIEDLGPPWQVPGHYGNGAERWGGSGGSTWPREVDVNGVTGYVINETVRPGRGGDCTVIAQDGSPGAPGQNGGLGGWAHAEAGFAGYAYIPHGYPLTSVELDADGESLGGNARGFGGNGGDGGDNCGDPSDEGGDGGDGGDADAIGGQGATAVYVGGETAATGPGGNGHARGGDGGNGGDGQPHGSGGPGGRAAAHGGHRDGTAREEPGTAGEPGEPCEQEEGLLVALNETVSGDGMIKLVANFLTNFWPTAAVAPQQEGAIELGGGRHSVYPLMGQTIALTADASKLFVSTTEHAVFIYDNPLQGGERGPDVRLTHSGAPDDTYRPEGIYYDHVRDILYVHGSVDFGGSDYHAWHDASTITANRPADRTLDPNNVGLPGSAITGDPAADRLFIPGGDRVLVIDNASTAPSDVEFDADRRIDVEMDQRMGQGIAYDATRDRLYTGTVDFGFQAGDDCQLVIIDGASTADGLVEPEVLTGISDIDHWPLTLQVVPDGDALLVGFNRSDLVMFRNASALVSGPAPEPDERLDTVNVNAMGAVYLTQ